ncbi:type II toxin-antitoxin system VapB family antitoxin [Deltaproteobacteria bacterium PRO3]|nr:type II toxin-antitoxin system VapB family antitoxin [Deltaproteobacteria bacterium PRO3]
MRTNLILKDELLKRAAELTQITEKTALVHAGLQALIEKYARARLAALGGTEKKLRPIRRRRTVRRSS